MVVSADYLVKPHDLCSPDVAGILTLALSWGCTSGLFRRPCKKQRAICCWYFPLNRQAAGEVGGGRKEGLGKREEVEGREKGEGRRG